VQVSQTQNSILVDVHDIELGYTIGILEQFYVQYRYTLYQCSDV